MLSRRNFLTGSAVALAGAALVTGRAQAAAIPEAPSYASPAMQPPRAAEGGDTYQPVVTLNGWTLPYRTQWRLEGVPSPRGRGDAGDRSRHDGQALGL